MSKHPRWKLNPGLLDKVNKSGLRKATVAAEAGFPFYSHFYITLRSEKIVASPQMVERLLKIADIVGFPRGDVFVGNEAIEAVK